MRDLAGLRPQRPATVLPAMHCTDVMVQAVLLRHRAPDCTAGMVQDVLPRHSEMADPSLANVDRILLVFACALPTFDTLQVGAVRPALSLTPSGGRRSAVGDLSVSYPPLTWCTRTPPACGSQQSQAVDGKMTDVRLSMLACEPVSSRAAAQVVSELAVPPSCACRPPSSSSLLRPLASLFPSS